MRRRKHQVSYKITHKSFGILRELNDLSVEIAPHLGLASPAAQVEWARLRATWPSPEHLDCGEVGLSTDELRAIVAKVRRFQEILFALAPGRPVDAQRKTTEE